jgi:hypothetical protein
MKVYVVACIIPYEGCDDPEAVFSSLERAKEYQAAREKNLLEHGRSGTEVEIFELMMDEA